MPDTERTTLVADRLAISDLVHAYCQGVDRRDAEGVASLFTEDGTYQETPFAEPMRRRSAIAGYWSRATGSHTSVHFGYELLALDSNQTIAHWWCSFARPPAKASLKLDGIFLLQFDGE